MLVALAVVWGVGGTVLLRGLDERQAAQLTTTTEAARGVLEDAQAALVREARMMARDPAVVEGTTRGDWTALARGASPRLIALTVERLADLLFVVDAGGRTLMQVPALPQLSVPELVAPATPSVAVRVVGGRAFLFGLASVRAGGAAEGPIVGVALVGRRLDQFERLLSRIPGTPSIAVVAGDRLLGGTRADLPASGWEAGVRDGTITVPSGVASVRPLSALGLWAVLPLRELRAERNALVLALIVSFVLAAVVAVGAGWLGRVPARSRRELLTQSRELDALYAVARTMASGAELAPTAEQLLDIGCAVARMDVGVVYRQEGRTLQLVAQRGLTPVELSRMRTRPSGGGPLGEAARTGQVIVTDLASSVLLDTELRDFAASLGRRTQLTLPISASGRAWGVMALVSPDRRRLSADEMKLLDAVAHQIGLAVARASLAAEAREKGQRLESLSRLTQSLTATLSLEEVLQRVVDAAVAIFAASEARVWLVEEDGRGVSLQAVSGTSAPIVGEYRFAVGEGLVGIVVERRQPLVIADLAADPRLRNIERVRAEGLASFAAVPVTLGDRVLGVLAIAVRQPHQYTPEEVGLLQSLAHHAGVAIDNASRFAREAARRDQLAALLEINKKIGAAQSVDALLGAIAEEAARLLDLDNASFRLLDGDDLVLTGLAGTARQAMLRARIKIGESFSGRVVQQGQTLIADADEVPELIPEHRAVGERLGYTCYLGVPLRVGERIFGALAFRARRRFTDRDRETAEAFADQASVALEHSRLFSLEMARRSQIETVSEVEREFAAELNLDRLGRLIVDRASGLLQAQGVLFLAEPDATSLTPTAWNDQGLFDQPLAFGEDVAGACAAEQGGLLVNDYARFPQASADRVVCGLRRIMAHPLVLRDRLLGVLSLFRCGDDALPFGPRDFEMLASITNQAAIAIDNARLHDAAERRSREAQELARLAQRLTESLEMSAVGERIVESVISLLGVHSAGLRLIRPDGSMVAVAWGGPPGEHFEVGDVRPPGTGLVGRAVAEGRALWSADALEDPDLVLSEQFRDRLQAFGHRAALAVPLQAKGRIIGALVAADAVARTFTPSEIALAQAFADQAALALENARLHEETVQRRREAEALAQLSRTLTETLDLDAVYERIVGNVPALFGVRSAGLSLLRPDGGLQLVAVGGDAPAKLVIGNVVPSGVGVGGRAVRESRPVWSADVLNDPTVVLSDDLRRSVEASGDRAFLAVPLRVKNEIIGVLIIADSVVRSFSEAEIELLRAVGDQAALALENARLHEETEERRRNAEALAQVARVFAETLDVGTVYTRVVEHIPALLGVRSASLRLLRPDGGLEAVGFGGTWRGSLPSSVLARGVGVGGVAALEGRPVSSVDILNDPAFELPEAVRRGVEETGNRAFLAVPLRVKGEVVGVVTIADPVPRPFTPAEVELLEAVSNQAALALENAWLHEETVQRRREAEVLADLARSINASLDQGTVLQRIAVGARELTGSDIARIALRDVDTDRVLYRYWVGARYQGYDQVALEPGKGVSGYVMRTGRPFRTDDYLNDTRITQDYAGVVREEGIVAGLSVPIRIGDRVEGLLDVSNRAPRPFTDRHEAILLRLADQAAIAIQNARLYESVEIRATRLRTLANVTRIVSSSLDADEVLRGIAGAASELMGGAVVGLWVADEEAATLRISTFSDGEVGRDFPFASIAVEFGQAAVGWVATHRRPLHIPDVQADPRYLAPEWARAHGIVSFQGFPIVLQSSLLGVLALYGRAPFALSEDDQGLLESFAAQAAIALDHARLYAQTTERLEETRALLEVGRVLSEPATIEAMLRGVTRVVGEAFGADMVGASLLDERREALRAASGWRVPKELREWFATHPMILEHHPGLFDEWRAGRVAWSGDPHHDPRFNAGWIADMPTHSVLFAPTRVRGESMGAIFVVWWQTGREFKPSELRLLEGVTAQVGLAVENAELGRQRELRLQETETLLAVSRSLSSSLDLDTLLRHFMQQITRATGADAIGVWMLDASGQWLTPMAGYHVSADWLTTARELRLSVVDHPFYAEAARTRRAVFSRDVSTDPRVPAFLVNPIPHHSQLFVPILVKDRLVGGFVAFWAEQGRDFAASELALMEAIGNQAGVALESVRLFDQNRRQVEELTVLHELSRAVTGQLDQKALLAALHQQLPRVLPVDQFVVLLVDEQAGGVEVALRVSDGELDDPSSRDPRAVGLAEAVRQTGRPLRTEDYAAECERRGLSRPEVSGPPRWLGVPMLASDTVLGVLTLSRHAQPFTQAEERLAANIAALAALALRSARLFEERTRAFSDLAAAHDHLVRTEKLRALGEMASGVAHDFNNLLSAILGRTQLLLRRVDDAKLRQWLQVIERSALDGAQTVRRLQDFARVRRDQPMVPLDLNQVVRDALEITQSRWREDAIRGGVSIEVNTRLVSLPSVAGDAAELREAMTNLILNALDAMPDGGTLTLSTAIVNNEIEVAVADTGAGMSETVRQKIFDPFFSTKGPQGTGLGLSMTYGIVSRHGARISVESEEGQGSTFRIIFPPTQGLASGRLEPLRSAAPPVVFRCLVVDDEEAVGSVIGDVLETLGHQAVVLTRGADAIARLRSEPFDVVFTDLAMPGVSGWQVARAVKEITPLVPVFLVTGFGVELSAEEMRGHGVEAVFPKPLRIEDIVTAISQVNRMRGSGSEES